MLLLFLHLLLMLSLLLLLLHHLLQGVKQVGELWVTVLIEIDLIVQQPDQALSALLGSLAKADLSSSFGSGKD